MSEKRILIIDDDLAFSESVRTVLESDGYVVEERHTGSEGVKAAEELSPDLIMLDVMMEHTTTGFEVCRELRKHPSLCTVPILLVTGISHEMSLPFSFEANEEYLPVHEVVEKPVSPKALLEKIHAMLA